MTHDLRKIVLHIVLLGICSLIITMNGFNSIWLGAVLGIMTFGLAVVSGRIIGLMKH